MPSRASRDPPLAVVLLRELERQGRRTGVRPLVGAVRRRRSRPRRATATPSPRPVDEYTRSPDEVDRHARGGLPRCRGSRARGTRARAPSSPVRPGPEPARMKPSTISSGVAPGCGRSGRNEKSGGGASTSAVEPGWTGPLVGSPAHAGEDERDGEDGQRTGCRGDASRRSSAGCGIPRSRLRRLSAIRSSTSIGCVSPSASTAGDAVVAGIGRDRRRRREPCRPGAAASARSSSRGRAPTRRRARRRAAARRRARSRVRGPCRRSCACATGRRARSGRTRARRPAGVIPSP